MSEYNYNTHKHSLKEAIEFVLVKKAKKLVDNSIVGRWLFLALKKGNECEIISCRFYKELDSTEWKFEWFSENNPPEMYTCPEKILSLSTSTSPTALDWRTKCADKKRQKAYQRSLNNAKFQVFSEMTVGKSTFEIEKVGQVIFEGFYRQSKSEIVVKLPESQELRKLRISSIDIDLLKESLSILTEESLHV